MGRTRRASAGILELAGAIMALVAGSLALVGGGDGGVKSAEPATTLATVDGASEEDASADAAPDLALDLALDAAEASAPAAALDVDAAAAPAENDPGSQTPEELLAEQVAIESQQGACGAPYQALRGAFARFVTEQRARVAKLVVPGVAASFPTSAVDAAARTLAFALPRHVCRASAGGTWALVYDEFRGVLAEEMSARFLADHPDDVSESGNLATYPSFHVTAKGRLVFLPADEAPRQETAFLLAGAPLLSFHTIDGGFQGAATTVGDLDIGDIDGDGAPELLVTGRSGELPLLEGGDTRTHVAAVYRVTAEGIELAPHVPPGVPFDHLVDGDGDGLFDLTSPLPFFGRDDGTLGDLELQGPELLFHALAAGGFSRADAAARDFAKKSCPARPTGLPAPPADARAGDGSLVRIYLTESGDRAIHDVACARLWGVPTETVRAWVERINGGPELARWAALSPPLQLTP